MVPKNNDCPYVFCSGYVVRGGGGRSSSQCYQDRTSGYVLYNYGQDSEQLNALDSNLMTGDH